MIWAVGGSAIALVGIFQRSLWQDEAITAGLAHGDAAGLWRGIVADRGNMSLFYVIETSLAPMSDSDAWLRIPSVISFGLLLGFLWSLANRVAGSAAAHVTAALSVTSVALVYYGQEARSYAAVAAAAVAMMWLLERALRTPSTRRWMILVLVSVLGAYLHVVILFFLPGLFAVGYLRSSRSERLRVVGAAFVGAVACLPLAIGIAVGGDDQVAWLPALGLSELVRIAVALTGSHFVDEWPIVTAALAGGVAVFVAVGAVSLIDRSRPECAVADGRGGLSALDVAVAGIVIPVVLMLGASLVSPLTAPRYYLHVVPFVLLLAAVGILAIPRPAVSRGFLAVVVSLGALRTIATFGEEDVPWRSVQEYVDGRASDGDIVHALIYWERAPFDWYHWRDGETVLLGLPPRQVIVAPQHPYPDEPSVGNLAGMTVFIIGAEGDNSAVMQFLDDSGAPFTVLEVVSFGDATVTRARFS